MFSRVTRHGGLICFAALLGASGVYAQDYKHVAPKVPLATAPTVATAPTPAPLVSPSSGTVLVPDLKGLVFVSGAAALAPDGLQAGAAGSTGVALKALPVSADPKFEARLDALIGKPLTTDGVALIRSETKAFLTAHGRPYVEVTVPPQNVSSGIVQVVVTQYRLGHVSVSGERYFSKKVVEAPNDLTTGQILTLPEVQGDVNRLNQNPFLSVDAVFKPGQEPGTTDLDLVAKDRLPLRVYAGYDNQGYPLLGLQEFSAGVNWGNAFGDGQILSYQYTRSFNGRFASHSASDVIPVTGADKILIFGSYAILKPQIATDFDDEGHSGQISGRFVHSFRATSWLTGDVQAGYDFKFTNNNLQFFGTTIVGNQLQVDQFPITIDLTESDRRGQTAVENDLIFSPGNMTGGNNDTAVQSLVPGGTARYAYDRFSVTRTTRLPWNLSWVARVAAQASTGILPNSEQLGGGGIGSVRGYFTDTALGSVGILTNQELRLPAFSPSGLIDKGSTFGDQVQFGGFFDVGEFRQPKTVVGGAAQANLASAGFLAHYSIGRRFDVDFDMGWQLRPAPGSTDLGYYGAIALSVAY